MTEQEFIKNCKERGLTTTQAQHCLDLYKYSKDIEWSFKKAKLDFDEFQMQEAYKAFKNGLTKEQVEVFYKKEFDCDQMQEVRFAFQNGLAKDQIEVFCKKEFNACQIAQARYAFEIN